RGLVACRFPSLLCSTGVSPAPALSAVQRCDRVLRQDTLPSMTRYRVIDAFTDVPGTGNPAAVIQLDAAFSDRWARTVAAEFNLSETAFAVALPQGVEADHELRWFT